MNEGSEDLWFLPGQPEDEAMLAPLPRVAVSERDQVVPWERAQAALALPLARVAARLGALDDRLLRAPKGWRHRLALSVAADLSWFAGERVTPERLALWLSLRLAGAQEDAQALARVGWAMRRLSSGPGPEEGLQAFLGRHEPGQGAEPLGERIESWQSVMAHAGDLHPLVRAAFGFYLWPMAGLGHQGDRLEAAVTAARLAAGECRGGANFVPLSLPGAGRGPKDPEARLRAWIEGAESAILKAMRQLDQLERWQSVARDRTAKLSGRTPGQLLAVLAEWPLVSAPMAEHLTGVSRAAVQRNLTWLTDHGLICEVTGQGRYRFWSIEKV